MSQYGAHTLRNTENAWRPSEQLIACWGVNERVVSDTTIYRPRLVLNAAVKAHRSGRRFTSRFVRLSPSHDSLWITYLAQLAAIQSWYGSSCCPYHSLGLFSSILWRNLSCCYSIGLIVVVKFSWNRHATVASNITHIRSREDTAQPSLTARPGPTAMSSVYIGTKWY